MAKERPGRARRGGVRCSVSRGELLVRKRIANAGSASRGTRASPRVFQRVTEALRRNNRLFVEPAVTRAASSASSPFRVLIACLLSLRTRDPVTALASARLFALAADPERLRRVPIPAIEKAIYPVSFFRNKARTVVEVSRAVVEQHGGRVPDEIDTLLTLKGVGRKTANLVVTLGYGRPGICVDTHVHRISNRLGWVETRSPEQTEQDLRKLLPKRYWIEINDLLVTHGQNVCKPTSPICSVCPVERYCSRAGVTRSR